MENNKKPNPTLESWKNEDNISFYEKTSIDNFINYAKIGGLDTCNDVEILSEFLTGKETILDIGSGYGRVLHYLNKKFCSVKLIAVERSKSFCQYINNHNPNVELFNIDFMALDDTLECDVALLLWSGLSDYHKIEHIILLKKIMRHLKKEGVFFTDLLLDDFHHPGIVDNIKQKNKNYQFQDHEETAYGYCPSLEELYEYAQILNIKKVIKRYYKTSTGRNRVLIGFFK